MTKKKDFAVAERAKVLEKAAPVVNRPVGGDFTRIDDATRRTVLLRATPHARQTSTLWTKDRVLTKKFFVSRYIEYLDTLECELSGRASRILGEVDRELDRAENEQIYFNLRCEESTLFFHVHRRQIKSRDGKLMVELPKEIFEVQRRAQLRYRADDFDHFVLESPTFPQDLGVAKVLDISSGGIGVHLRFHDAEGAANFRLAEQARIQLRLEGDSFSISTQGEIRYLKRDSDPATEEISMRIGVRFVGLPQDTVEAIQLFVMERSFTRLQDMFGE
jgi:hypothetical protein